MIREILQPQTHRARKKRLELMSDLKERIIIHSNPAFLHTIIGNIVSNAIDYSPENSTVKLRATSNGSNFNLQISNEAPNLSEESANKMFDRFWRAEPSRSSNSHSGLGLPLSKAIADQLGFELTATWRNNILSITLSGPRATNPSRHSTSISDHDRDAIPVSVNSN